jgi:hypothetical protein
MLGVDEKNIHTCLFPREKKCQGVDSPLRMTVMATRRRAPTAEWLEADGLGGFASGTVSGRATRRYHALLLTATTPPTGRFVLVNESRRGWRRRPGASRSLAALHDRRTVPRRREPDRVLRAGAVAAVALTGSRTAPPSSRSCSCRTADPLACCAGESSSADDRRAIRLFVRPLMSGRDYHSICTTKTARSATTARSTASV